MSAWGRGLVDLALTGYVWAAVQALAEIAGRRATWLVPTPVIVVTAWLSHTLGLGLRGLVSGHAPIGGLHLVLSAIVWVAVLGALWGERRYAMRSLYGFVLGPAAALGLVAAAMPEAAVFPVTTAPWAREHAVFVVVGFGALAANFAGSLMYLLQERAIRRGRLWGLSRRLPALDALDRFAFHALVAGFPFLTLGIGLGTTSGALAYGAGWLWQPTSVVALATWLVYGLVLFLRAGGGWGGRRAAYLAVAAFAGLVATLSVSLLLPTRHVAV